MCAKQGLVKGYAQFYACMLGVPVVFADQTGPMAGSVGGIWGKLMDPAVFGYPGFSTIADGDGSKGADGAGGRHHRCRRDPRPVAEAFFPAEELRRMAAPGCPADAQGYIAPGHRTGKAELFHQRRAEAKSTADLVVLAVTFFTFRHLRANHYFYWRRLLFMNSKGMKTVCGLDCGDCAYVKEGCRGCNAEKGAPFWTSSPASAYVRSTTAASTINTSLIAGSASRCPAPGSHRSRTLISPKSRSGSA